MERGNLSRLLLIAGVVILMITVLPRLLGGGSSGRQALKGEGIALGELVPIAATRSPEELCRLWTPEFHAELSSRSATLKRFDLVTAKYTKHGKPTALSTTPDVESRRQLRVHFSNPAADVKADDWLVRGDLLDYELVRSTNTSCEFRFRDDRVEINERFTTTGRPYELELTTTLKNLATRPLSHAVTVHSDAWRTHKEVAPGFLRNSYLMTHVECVPMDG